jgi:hypothetical protein
MIKNIRTFRGLRDLRGENIFRQVPAILRPSVVEHVLELGDERRIELE